MATVNSVTCKRKITLKNIVTETFKINLVIEIQNNINNIQNNINQIEQVITKIRQESGDKQPDIKQIEQERLKLMAQKKMSENRIQEVKQLKHGSIYTTSQVDGFTQLKPVDDVREKLGNVEILCKDYIIQKMTVHVEEEVKEQFVKPVPINIS
jgi:hypothetical protein